MRIGVAATIVTVGQAPRFADHYSSGAGDYARFRPRYPPTLFAWLAAQCARRSLAWDCATGNGQAAAALVPHFDRVAASDAAPAQLAHASRVERVHYRAALAEESALPAASADLVTVAQALHWFALERFWAETRRVLRPGGVIAVWCYQLFAATPDVDAIIERYYGDIVGRYWPPERAILERGYGDLPFPFDELSPPRFAMEAEWSLADLVGYLGTWSATRRAEAALGRDPREEIRKELASAWGERDARTLRWPLLVRAGRA